MTSARFVFPKLKLEKLLQTPGGSAIADLLVDADRNLATLKPTCHAELLALLQEAEATAAGLGAEASDEVLSELYVIAVRGIGAGSVSGVPDVDGALDSLCDLIDALQSSGLRHAPPLGVHLGAWRLLMDPNLAPTDAAAMVEGLRKVSARYA